MRIEDREEFVDQVAQAVIDKIEERDRIDGMVSLVVARVLALQKAQAEAASILAEAPISTEDGSSEEKTHAEH
jgi:hypothetical protein